MDRNEAEDLIDTFSEEIKSEIDAITLVMIRLAWFTFVKKLYETNHEIIDRTVSEEYVKGKKKTA